MTEVAHASSIAVYHFSDLPCLNDILVSHVLDDISKLHVYDLGMGANPRYEFMDTGIEVSTSIS